MTTTALRMYDPQIAQELGTKEAIVINRLSYLAANPGRVLTKQQDGRVFIRNSMKNWVAYHFQDFSQPTLNRVFNRLRELGIVVAEKLDRAYSRTLWYALDPQRLAELIGQKQPAKAEPTHDKPAPETAVSETPENNDLIVSRNDQNDRFLRKETKENKNSPTERGQSPPPRLSSSMIIAAYRAIFKLNPKKGQAEIVAQAIQDLKLFRLACELWLMAGYRPLNLQGIMEWYQNLEQNPDWRPGPGQHKGGDSGIDAAWQSVKAAAARAVPPREDEKIMAVLRHNPHLWEAIKNMDPRYHERTIHGRFTATWKELYS